MSHTALILCRYRRLIALGLALLAAVTLCAAAWVAPSRGLAWYAGRVSFSLHLYVTPYYRGRKDVLDPSPRCCRGPDCLPLPGAGHYAVMTLLRTDQYLGLTQASRYMILIKSLCVPHGPAKSTQHDRERSGMSVHTSA